MLLADIERTDVPISRRRPGFDASFALKRTASEEELRPSSMTLPMPAEGNTLSIKGEAALWGSNWVQLFALA